MVGDHQLRVRRFELPQPHPDVAAGGLHLAALSNRFSTARDIPAASPNTCQGETSTSKSMSLRRRRTRSKLRSITSAMSIGSCTTSPASSRVRSTKSPTSVDNSSICASTSARRSTISCSGSGGAPGCHRGHQQFDVGAQRRQRGTQFVTGIGDQARLAFPGLGQRAQHHVESLSESCQFVAAEHREWAAGRRCAPPVRPPRSAGPPGAARPG